MECNCQNIQQKNNCLKKIVIAFLCLNISLLTAQNITNQTGKSIYFNGKRNNIIIKSPIKDSFTIQFWMKTTQVGPIKSLKWYHGVGLLDADIPNDYNDFGITLLINKLAFGIGNQELTVQSKTNVNTGKWVHVSVCWEKKRGFMQIYINGKLESEAYSLAFGTRTAKDIYIGSMRKNFNYYHGSLDEIRIWNRVLSKDEINYNKDFELDNIQNDLLAYYNCNNHGTHLKDESQNKSHGKFKEFSTLEFKTAFRHDTPVQSKKLSIFTSYKKVYIIILFIILMIFAIYLNVKYRLAQLKKRNKKLEEKVATRTFELENALREQASLLKEVHHRVKNNLQFIGAMLQMQIKNEDDTKKKSVLNTTARRINAMSLVHEMLYKKDQVAHISVYGYLTELISTIGSEFYNNTNKTNNIKYKINIANLYLNITDCVAIGMITSELISNSKKYAFDNIKNPIIAIQLALSKDAKSLTYEISDNGNGFAMEHIKEGLGMRLIGIFSTQLKGIYNLNSSISGTSFIIKKNL